MLYTETIRSYVESRAYKRRPANHSTSGHSIGQTQNWTKNKNKNEVDAHIYRGRPKVEIPLSVVTESRPKVTYHIRPKPYVPPKVKRDFRPKTETESQSYLSRHDYRSQQVPPSSVAWLSHASDIFHI